ncbi:MAG: hypothetical protein PHS37_07365, partial [Candidatus Omnitrophica bacterium]|nr:hypothetical protein [Candidatus Omnitrophota bacterium]
NKVIPQKRTPGPEVFRLITNQLKKFSPGTPVPSSAEMKKLVIIDKDLKGRFAEYRDGTIRLSPRAYDPATGKLRDHVRLFDLPHEVFHYILARSEGAESRSKNSVEIAAVYLALIWIASQSRELEESKQNDHIQALFRSLDLDIGAVRDYRDILSPLGPTALEPVKEYLSGTDPEFKKISDDDIMDAFEIIDRLPIIGALDDLALTGTENKKYLANPLVYALKILMIRESDTDVEEGSILGMLGLSQTGLTKRLSQSAEPVPSAPIAHTPSITPDKKATAEELRRRYLTKGDDIRNDALDLIDSDVGEAIRVPGALALKHQRTGAKKLLEGSRGRFLLARTSAGKTVMIALAVFLRWIMRINDTEVVTVSSPNKDKIREDGITCGRLLSPYGITVGLIEKDADQGQEIGYRYDTAADAFVRAAPDNEESVRIASRTAYALYGHVDVFEHLELRERHAMRPEDQILTNRPTVMIDDEFDERNVLNFANPAILSGSRADDADIRIERITQAAEWLPVLDTALNRTVDRAGKHTRLTIFGIMKLRSILRHNGYRGSTYADWKNSVETLLTAYNNFQKDTDGGYEVVGNDIVIISDSGTRSPGSEWQGDLHNAVRLKEGLPLQPANKVIASISRKAFVNRPNVLIHCGTSGTEGIENFMVEMFGRDKADVELLDIFDATGAKAGSSLKVQGAQLFMDRASKDDAVVNRIRALHADYLPVIVSVPDKRSADELRARLEYMMPVSILDSGTEAQEVMRIVAGAGRRASVTIITPRGTRGSDYRLQNDLMENLAKKGGMRMVSTYFPKFTAFQIQEMGRVGRQGDPGTWEAFWSLEDDTFNECRELAGTHQYVLKRRLQKAHGKPLTDQDELDSLVGEIRQKIVERHLKQTREEARLSDILYSPVALSENPEPVVIQDVFYRDTRRTALSGRLVADFFALPEIKQCIREKANRIRTALSGVPSDQKRALLTDTLFRGELNLSCLNLSDAEREYFIDTAITGLDAGQPLEAVIVTGLTPFFTGYALLLFDRQWSTFQTNFERLREEYRRLTWQLLQARYPEYALQARSAVNGIYNTIQKAGTDIAGVFLNALNAPAAQGTPPADVAEKKLPFTKRYKSFAVIAGVALISLGATLIFRFFGIRGDASLLTNFSPMTALLIGGACLIIGITLKPYVSRIDEAQSKMQERVFEHYDGVGQGNSLWAIVRYGTYSLLSAARQIAFITSLVGLFAVTAQPAAGNLTVLCLTVMSIIPVSGAVMVGSNALILALFGSWMKESPARDAKLHKPFTHSLLAGIVLLAVTAALVNVATGLNPLFQGLVMTGTCVVAAFLISIPLKKKYGGHVFDAVNREKEIRSVGRYGLYASLPAFAALNYAASLTGIGSSTATINLMIFASLAPYAVLGIIGIYSLYSFIQNIAKPRIQLSGTKTSYRDIIKTVIALVAFNRNIILAGFSLITIVFLGYNLLGMLTAAQFSAVIVPSIVLAALGFIAITVVLPLADRRATSKGRIRAIVCGISKYFLPDRMVRIASASAVVSIVIPSMMVASQIHAAESRYTLTLDRADSVLRETEERTESGFLDNNAITRMARKIMLILESNKEEYRPAPVALKPEIQTTQPQAVQEQPKQPLITQPPVKEPQMKKPVATQPQEKHTQVQKPQKAAVKKAPVALGTQAPKKEMTAHVLPASKPATELSQAEATKIQAEIAELRERLAQLAFTLKQPKLSLEKAREITATMDMETLRLWGQRLSEELRSRLETLREEISQRAAFLSDERQVEIAAIIDSQIIPGELERTKREVTEEIYRALNGREDTRLLNDRDLDGRIRELMALRKKEADRLAEIRSLPDKMKQAVQAEDETKRQAVKKFDEALYGTVPDKRTQEVDAMEHGTQPGQISFEYNAIRRKRQIVIDIIAVAKELGYSRDAALKGLRKAVTDMTTPNLEAFRKSAQAALNKQKKNALEQKEKSETLGRLAKLRGVLRNIRQEMDPRKEMGVISDEIDKEFGALDPAQQEENLDKAVRDERVILNRRNALRTQFRAARVLEVMLHDKTFSKDNSDDDVTAAVDKARTQADEDADKLFSVEELEKALANAEQHNAALKKLETHQDHDRRLKFLPQPDHTAIQLAKREEKVQKTLPAHPAKISVGGEANIVHDTDVNAFLAELNKYDPDLINLLSRNEWGKFLSDLTAGY